ncbi:MAG: hybrid sensor histidine kinase/response regulator [Bacteroidales bacterium]|jgi:signal transduction histidine kinase|nr:hybrid sensor histidine kinase/response regulator [Bacteroidales bacterium]
MDKLKILVVDDEFGIRSGVKRILEKFEVDYPFMDEAIGFEVTEAETGEIAISLLKKEEFAIVLLDNKLPGIQGIEVLEYINSNNIDSKVVMITSYASLELAVKATREGAIDFVPKPFTPQELRSSVENITKQMFLKKMTSKLQKEGKQIRFQFLSLLSHELKAPVNAVEGYLKIIKDHKNGDNINAYMPMIDRSIERLKAMRTMIMDLLDFTKIESGQAHKNIQPLDLGEIAKTCIASTQPLAIQKDVRIYLNYNEKVIYNIDPTDFEIILNNILSNAVKYNKQNGRVDCTIREMPDHIEVLVSDTGIGIKEEDQQKLFNEFVRIKNENTQKIPGSGLGLSIVKRILENYDSEIKLESVINQGTTIKIILKK